MQVIEELRLRNFQAYRSVDISFTSGLTLLRGRNGAGKSTLINAIVFGLFGEVPNVRPNALVSRLSGADEMEVYVRFVGKNGEKVEVTRIGKNTEKGYTTTDRRLAVDGADEYLESDSDLRRRVVDHLGISFRRFLNLVYIGQGSLPDVLNPDKDTMDSILGINTLRELSEEFDEVRKGMERYEGEDVDVRIRREEGLKGEKGKALPKIQIERLTDETKDIEDSIKKAESESLINLLKLIRKRDQSGEEAKISRKEREESLASVGAKSVQDIEALLSGISGELESAGKEFDSASRRESQINGEISKINGLEEGLRGELEEHQRLLAEGKTVCPTCGSKITKEKMKALVKTKEAAIRKYEKQKSALAVKLSDASEGVQKAEDLIRQIEDRERNAKTALESTRRWAEKENAATAAVGKLVGQIKEALKSLGLDMLPDDESLEAKVSSALPLGEEELQKRRRQLKVKQDELRQAKDEKETLEGEIRALESDLAEMKKRMEVAEKARNVVAGFAQAIQKRRDEMLSRISYQALSYYNQMTDQRDYDSIDIDPDDYSVHLHPLNLVERIPATRLGGGHQTLVSLALRLALLDAIEFRNLLILDEPTDGVDSQNLPHLEQYLGEMSRLLSQMILVTHHDICSEEATSLIEVAVKDGESVAESAN